MVKKNPIGFWELSDKPSLDELRSYYNKKYYQNAKGSYEIKYSEEELNYFRIKLEQRAFIVDQLISTDNPKSLLDVGCGEGFTLPYFENLGWKVKGIDFSSAGIKAQNPLYENHILVGDIFELMDQEINSGQTYSIVWLQNVLEHVLNPVELLEKLKQLVSTNGLAVITVPNDFSITQKWAMDTGLIDRQYWIVSPDHISYFDKDSLSSICKHTGWNQLDLVGDFPIDWFLFNDHSNYIKYPDRGKSVHRAKIGLETLIGQIGPDKAMKLFRSIADAGFGRNLTIFVRPK
jgi:2-polyprenyl-3-methyl-5-hydroxy-6-metoxy-1,4-benzoquinol methylase